MNIFCRLFKVNLAILCFVLTAYFTNAQTFEKDFKDGAIHFKIKDNVFLKYNINEDKTFDISQFAFLNEINTKYVIKKLSRPYDIAKDPKILRIFLLEFSDFENINSIIADLQKIDIIEYAEKCPRRYPLWTPNDPYYALTSAGFNWNWHLDQVKASLAWDIQKGVNTVKVGIVDNAIWGSHPDLNIPTNHQYNATTQVAGNSAPPTSISQTGSYPSNITPYEWSHGTHCAGNIAAINNNGVGVCSLAGGDGSQASGVQLYAARADDGSGMYNTYINNGINWCVNQGCKVISLSLGGYTSSSTDQALINSAVTNYGVTFVASAGNNGDGGEDPGNTNAVVYPAGYPNVISVAATNEDKKLATFSEYGTWVDIAAPGGYMNGGETYGMSELSTTYCHNLVTAYVLSSQNPITGTSNYYDVMQGTSMSCPITASLCALMLSRNSTLTPAQILSCLQSTSQTLASGSHTIATGKGIIDAQAALNCVAPTTGVTAFFTPSVTSGVAPLTVQFTNTSTGNPTPNSYIWAWGDGTSNTTVTTTATQTHNFTAAGNYTVTLTASNGTNSDTYTATINVTNSGGGTCDTLSNILDTEDLTLYGFGTGQWGTWTGHNSYSIAEFAEYYTGMTVNSINGLQVYVADAVSGGTGGNHKVTFKVYAGGGTTPGTVLGSKDVAITALTPYDYNYIQFDNPVAFTGTDVYVGYQIYYNSPADTFSVAQAVTRTNNVNSGFLKNGSNWASFPSLSGNSLYSAIWVSPMVCGGCTAPSTPTVGTVTQPTCTVSTGSVVLNGLPSSGTWTITRNPGSVTTTGTGTTKTLTGIPAGTYTFSVTNSEGCTSLATNSVTLNSVSVPATPTITQNGNVLHSSATSGNQWYNQTGLIGGAVYQNYTVTANGTYYVKVTQNGCESNQSNSITISGLGIENIETNNLIKVYPNPVSDELVIEINDGSQLSTIKISNIIGQIVYNGEMKDKKVISVAGFAKGVYMVKIDTGKEIIVKKIVKE